MADKNVALRKHQQITKANRTMFFWVAGISVIVGFAVVAGIFLARQMLFNTNIIRVKSQTLTTIRSNQAAVTELKNNTRALNSNQDLTNLKAQPDDKALQVVLDALPADVNATALGSSLQNKLLADTPGITLQTLSIENTGNTDESVVLDNEGDLSNVITFRMDVTGSADALKNLLLRFERSIRAIDVIGLTLEQSNDVLTMKIEARAFYEPPRTIELRDTEVKP
jgi:hypothetical protein